MKVAGVDSPKDVSFHLKISHDVAYDRFGVDQELVAPVRC